MNKISFFCNIHLQPKDFPIATLVFLSVYDWTVKGEAAQLSHSAFSFYQHASCQHVNWLAS